MENILEEFLEEKKVYFMDKSLILPCNNFGIIKLIFL